MCSSDSQPGDGAVKNANADFFGLYLGGMCRGLPSDAAARLCFPLFGFLMAISRSCSTCLMRTARSKPIIPDQTLNI